MKPDKFIDAVMIAVFMTFILFCMNMLFSKEVRAAGGTDCNEWATMTQILVLRWQGEHLPKPDGTQANNEDVKDQLRKTMNGHPELEQALKWVDCAWEHKDGNPVHVWQNARMKCEGTI